MPVPYTNNSLRYLYKTLEHIEDSEFPENEMALVNQLTSGLITPLVEMEERQLNAFDSLLCGYLNYVQLRQ